MSRILALLAGTTALAATSAQAQQSAQAEIYTRGAFKGPSMTFTGPTQHIDPAFTARSIRISGSAAWELCSGNTYTGCRRVDKSLPGAVFIVRSARPVAPVMVSHVSPPNQALRGVASEFFVAPNRGGRRVAVESGNPEQMRRAADEFCRSVGWQMSAHAQVQQDSDRFELIDVLCTNRP
ncbi:MAG TPA: hypothetical protein VE968_08710 [Sphingomicrobium sp.]|nr:hypothetical protein [Sphingomicrobium sp.]